jgi:hypothetical protein
MAIGTCDRGIVWNRDSNDEERMVVGNMGNPPSHVGHFVCVGDIFRMATIRTTKSFQPGRCLWDQFERFPVCTGGTA